MSYDIDELKKSMVRIINSNIHGSTNTAGSGFIIRSDGYFITCHHVICPLNLLSVEYQNKIYHDVQWCEDLSNLEVDIAILKINIPDAKAVPIINPQNLSTLVTVYGYPLKNASNFPNGFDFTAQNIRKSSSVNTLSTYGYNDTKLTNPWNKLPEYNSSFEAYRIDAPVDSGTSGGPVLADNLGGVIGVIQSSNDKHSYVIRWNNIIESLKKLGFDFNTVSQNQKEPIQILIELLQLSELTVFSERRGLCKIIGINPGILSFLTLPSDDNFATELIHYLHQIDRKTAICKLCQQLGSVFPEGEQAEKLAFVKTHFNFN